MEYIRICAGAYGEELAGLAVSFHALNQTTGHDADAKIYHIEL